MILTLPKPGTFASWNETLHRFLADSGGFEVRYADDLPRITKSQGGRRAGNLSVFAVDGRQIALDTWDTADPVTVAAERRCFDRGGPLADVVLVLKIQWTPANMLQYRGVPVPVRPWTIFPSREFPLGAFDYQPAKRHRYVAAVTGAMRYGRGEWFDYARRRSDWFVADAKRDMPMDEYVAILADCRWGLSLGGRRGTDMKNRREVEFASCGMPLALNYEPHYPFDFTAGRQFLHVASVEAVDLLLDTDPAPFAVESRRVWDDRFSPAGCAETMVELLNQAGLATAERW